MSNASALELATRGTSSDNAGWLHWIMLTATDPAAVDAVLALRPSTYNSFWQHKSMVATLLQEQGVDAAHALAWGVTHVMVASHIGPKVAGEAMASIGTPKAVATLASVAGRSKEAMSRLSLAVDRWPLAAIAALAILTAEGGKDEKLLAPFLTKLLRAHSQNIDALRPWLSPAAQRVIDRQLGPLDKPLETAHNDELPSVLASPPWLSKVRKKSLCTPGPGAIGTGAGGALG